jgi:hypothetical protein
VSSPCLMKVEVHALGVQFAQHLDQVLERALSLRSLAPEMPLSATTCTTFQPWRLATRCSSRR